MICSGVTTVQQLKKQNRKNRAIRICNIWWATTQPLHKPPTKRALKHHGWNSGYNGTAFLSKSDLCPGAGHPYENEKGSSRQLLPSRNCKLNFEHKKQSVIIGFREIQLQQLFAVSKLYF